MLLCVCEKAEVRGGTCVCVCVCVCALYLLTQPVGEYLALFCEYVGYPTLTLH